MICSAIRALLVVCYETVDLYVEKELQNSSGM